MLEKRFILGKNKYKNTQFLHHLFGAKDIIIKQNSNPLSKSLELIFPLWLSDSIDELIRLGTPLSL
jgi:hypothetical protein